MKMPNQIKLLFSVFFLFSLTGCTSYLSFTSTVPGEYHLGGVSKIALAGFNTLPNDPAAGIRSADENLVKMTENMVASVFFRGNTYRIANLDIEKMIRDSGDGAAARLAQRFDAVIYGRVWWQISPQNCNIYPQVYKLRSWRNVRYMSGRDSRGYPIYSVKALTTRITDQAVVQYYRAVNASLMLSITVYRLDGNGKIEKITEDFAAGDQQYLLDNGVFSTIYTPHDRSASSLLEKVASRSGGELRKDRAENERKGYLSADMNSTAIPGDLQTKIMLALKLTSQLSRKLTPSEIPVVLECDFDGGTRFLGISWGSDEKLMKLIEQKNYAGVRRYVADHIRMKAGNGIADRIGSISDYPGGSVTVPPDPRNITEDDVDDVVSSCRDHLYAMAISEEASRRYEAALETYRALFRVLPEKKYALGISRCLASLGLRDRLAEKKRAAEKAGKRASLN